MTDVGYIDTSCLLKLLLPEPESAVVAAAVDDEGELVVSSLADLEVRSQLLALRRGGALRFPDFRAATRRFDELLQLEPFHFSALGGDVFDTAVAQVKQRGAVHCRTLDRLHLAAMHVLGIPRLLTTDRQQARAARSLGLTVVMPPRPATGESVGRKRDVTTPQRQKR